MTRGVIRCVFAILIFMGLVGCGGAARYSVQIDAINTESANSKKSYIFLSDDKSVEENDLQFAEYMTYVKRALTGAGFSETTSDLDADIAVAMAYSISNPQTATETVSVPTFGVTGYGSSTKIGNTVFHNPTYGVTGNSVHNNSYTYFIRSIFLHAYDIREFKQSGKMKPVWKVAIKSTGSSGDLRRAFPVMVAAAQKYIGSNTGKQIEVTIRENNEVVLNIKGLQKIPPPEQQGGKE